MSILFIVNPAAGNGRAGKEWPKIVDLIKENFSEYSYEFTNRPLHAMEIARNAVLEGYETVVSCGGDGTLNEVINGIADSGTKVGIVPLGTGSDFGKTIGIRSVEDAIKALNSGKTERVDVNKVTFEETGHSRLFINVLEIGFGAEVMKYVNSHSKHGRSSFIIGILSTIWKLKKFKTGVELENLKDVDTIEVIVANGKYFGGGMLASPNSALGDGYLDVHILKPVSKISTILRLRNLIDGSYVQKNYSYENKVKSVRFGARGNLVEVDGEVVGSTPVMINVMENGINFIVP